MTLINYDNTLPCLSGHRSSAKLQTLFSEIPCISLILYYSVHIMGIKLRFDRQLVSTLNNPSYIKGTF